LLVNVSFSLKANYFKKQSVIFLLRQLMILSYEKTL